jgi:hypothetical protein
MEASTNDASSPTTIRRWVGGVVGMAACVAITLVAGMVARSTTGKDPNGNDGLFDPNGLVWLAVGGLPIAFLGGWALLPAARSGGWLTALGIGFVFGLVAPPLGAIEVVLVGLLPFSGATSGFDDNVTGFLFILPIALVYSYIAVVVTVPAGLLWALIVRAIPERRAV